MLLYSDVITDDEMFSDAFKVCVSIVHTRTLMQIHNSEIRKLVDDVVYEVDCAMITVGPGADVDIGNVDSWPAR